MKFQNEAYMTKGFESEIPDEHKLLIFNALEKAKGREKCDYLQVFKFAPQEVDGVTVQQMIHTQEEPPVSETYILVTGEIINTTVFVIDDETHHTYLLAEEY